MRTVRLRSLKRGFIAEPVPRMKPWAYSPTVRFRPALAWRNRLDPSLNDKNYASNLLGDSTRVS